MQRPQGLPHCCPIDSYDTSACTRSYTTRTAQPSLLVEAEDVLDILFAAQEDARPLVNALWLDVEDALRARVGKTSGLQK